MGAPLVNIKDMVMIGPINADHEEAENVATIRGPKSTQFRPQVSILSDMGNLDLQDKQGDRDRKHTIAKRFYPLRGQINHHFFWHDHH